MGAEVIGVAAREHAQAQRLLDDGMPFPLLLDPEQQVRRALGTTAKMAPLQLLHPRGLRAYARALRQGRFFDVTWSEATQTPGVAVLGPELMVQWVHRGSRLGDYPAPSEVLRRLEIAGSGR